MKRNNLLELIEEKDTEIKYLHKREKDNIEFELETYQDSLERLLNNPVIFRSLQQSGIHAHQCSIAYDPDGFDENAPDEEPRIMTKGYKYPWIVLVLGEREEHFRIWIDLEELKQANGKESN